MAGNLRLIYPVQSQVVKFPGRNPRLDCLVKSIDQTLWPVDDALEALAELDPRKGEIVELRFFGGLTVKEVAEVMNLSTATVAREWSKAKAWLLRELSHGEKS